jgi:hypothetical protein
MMNKYLLFSITSASLALSACGGGDDPVIVTPPSVAQVPASASASAGGLFAYLVELSLGSADTQELVGLDSFMPVQPDDAAPEPVK